MTNKTRFTFLYLDGNSIVFDADECKHYSGHAVLINARVVDIRPFSSNTIFTSYSDVLFIGNTFTRFNIALTGNLFGMYPSEIRD